jgi:predicted PurR-regulated permease PerM
MKSLIDKIKYFFVGCGIAILIVVFFVLKRDAVAKKLQKLLLKNYKQKANNIDKKLDSITEIVKVNNDAMKKFDTKIIKLDDKKRKIDEKVNALSGDDLIASVDEWFKSR